MEAASRGAAHVVMVENSPAVVRQLQDNAVKLNAHQVAIFRADALRYLEQYKHSGEESQFNLIFMDPPYNQDWLPKLLPQCRQALKPKGLLYVEAEFALGSEAPNDEPSGSLPDWLSNWRVVRAGKAGMVFHHLLEAVD